MIKSEVKAPVEMFVCVVVNDDGRSNGDETGGNGSGMVVILNRNNGGDRSGMVMVMTRMAVVVMVATGMGVVTVLMTGVAAMVTVITEMLVAICVAVVTVVGDGGDENSSWSGDDARKTNAVGSSPARK